MSFQTQTIRTESIWPRAHPAVRQKLFVVFVADHTLHCIATVHKTQEFQSHTTKQLQIFPWDKASKEGNEFFHRANLNVNRYLLIVDRILDIKTIFYYRLTTNN